MRPDAKASRPKRAGGGRSTTDTASPVPPVVEAPAPFQLVLLGRFGLTGPGGPIDLGSRKLCALLAYLACTAPQAQSREALTTLLWGSHFEAQARQNLRQGLSRLRRALGDDVLVNDDDTIRLRPAALLCDAERFESLVRAASHESLAAAVDLYRGTFLANIAIPEESWTDWVDRQRHRLEGLAVDALIRLGEEEERRGNPVRTLELANRAVAIDALREDGHRLVIRSLAAIGRRAEALKHYEQLAARLRRDLNVEPDAATASVIADVRQQRTVAAPASAAIAVPMPDAPTPATPVAADGPAAVPPLGAVDDTAAFERRARAVLVGDVVGYSRLMEAAELETHVRCRALRVGVSDPAIVSHRGEVVKNTGDGFVAVFESPADAVRCATALQEEIAVHEAGQPPERRIQFRMGAHWGPIILDANDVFGGGVNIAARLQTAAPAGGIVVSSALHAQVNDFGECRVDDLGELRLKNLSRPVHAFALLPPGADRGALAAGPGTAAGQARLPSIAVLPLANLSAEPGDSYFAEGFVEDIIVTLSNMPELLVVSRGSTMAFRRREVAPTEVSEKLGVRYLLTGSVRRTGSRIRISVELTDVATASVLWAEKYDSAMAEIFGVQDDIALEIVGKIATYIRRSEVRQALRKPPQNLNAYDHLLQALDLLYRLDFASFSRARALLERAREEDHDYAAPYAFAAYWHMFNIAEGWSSDTDADAAEVIRLSNCAIERDQCNAFALAIQGHARAMFYRDYDAALDLFDRALAVSPNSAFAWVFSSGTYGFVGNAPSGIARAERAIRLSPLDQQAFFNLCLLGQNHYLNGTFEDAIRWSRKAISLNPRFGNAVRVMAASLVAVGRAAEARQLAQHHSRILPRFRVSEYARRCPFKEPLASLYVERLEAAGIPV